MGRYCDLGYHDAIYNPLCYNKISYNYCFFIKFDKEYEKALDKLDIDWIPDDIIHELNIMINIPEGICADCFMKFKNLYTTDVSNNKIIPNETYLNLLQTVVPGYVPNNITWSFDSSSVYPYDEFSTEIVLNALNEYEKKVEGIDSNYEASELFEKMLSNCELKSIKKTQLIEYTKLHYDLIDLIDNYLDLDTDSD